MGVVFDSQISTPALTHRHRAELVNSDVIEINGDYCKVLDPELNKLGDLEETIEEEGAD